MRAAKELSPPELELLLSRFLEDFQDIIREHVQRAVKKKLGSRKRAAPVAAKPTKKGARGAKKKAKRSRGSAGRKPEQLSLF